MEKYDNSRPRPHSIEEPALIRRILGHGRAREAVAEATARAPPKVTDTCRNSTKGWFILPIRELFENLPQAERDAVLPSAVGARLAVELGVPQGWERYTGARGDMLGVERFGASAPAAVLLREYGFTVDNVCARAKALLLDNPTVPQG